MWRDGARWSGARLSLTLLTVLPVAGTGGRDGGGPDRWVISRRTAGRAIAWAPAVGLLLGSLAAVALRVAGDLLDAGPLVGSVLAVGALAALTGGLHLDGLADLADGLGSRAPAERALAIMRRSDVGPLGAATVTLTLLLQVAALARADVDGRGSAAIVAAAVTGRLAVVWACRRGVPAARPEGLGVLVAGTVHPAVPATATAAAVAAAATFAAWGSAGAAAVTLPVGVATGVVVSLLVTRYAVRRLGGITGDVLGALVEIATTVCLVVTAMG